MADEGYQPFPDITAWTAVPFDPTTYDQYAALLEQARAEATEEAREHAVRTAIRYAGTDTGAIEGLYTTDRGFTRTVAISAAGWEAAANERGPNAAQVIKDQIEAYEWLLDLVTESRPVTESVVRELHAILCRSQDTYTVQTDLGPQTRPLPKGEYKQFPNNPTSLATGQIHHYAPPDLVAPEVHRLVASLSTDQYRNAHPVVQAAYLHYSLVAIHPFADGNGRTTRALASVPLYRAAGVPLLVFRDQRDEYLDALGAADAGDPKPFVRFVEERVLDVADLVRNSARIAMLRDREASLAALDTARRISGLTEAELEAIASRIGQEVGEALLVQVNDIGWPAHLRSRLTEPDPPVAPPLGYRWTATPASSGLSVRSPKPALATASVAAHVAIATRDGIPAFLVASDHREVPDLALPARDVSPAFREIARIKIADWAALVADIALRSLARSARAAREAPPA